MKKTLFKLILFGCFWLVLSTSCQRDTNSEFNNYQRKIQENKWNHDQTIDDLLNQKSYTPLQN